MRRWTACVVSVALQACSFGTTGGPARPDPGKPIKCTDDYFTPVLDLVVGGLVGGYGIYLATGPECPDTGNEGCDAYGGRMSRGFGSLLVLTGAIYAGASLVGFSRVSSCRRALASRTAPSAATTPITR